MVRRVVGVLAVVAGGVVGAQPVLPLNVYSGPAGEEITASQGVSAADCETYTVFFDGAPVGTDDGSDGQGEVTFEVPAVEPGDYDVVAECSAGEADEIVGQAQFAVTGVPTSLPTTIGPTTTDELPTTTTTGTGGSTTSASDGTVAPPRNIGECEAQAAEAEGSLVYEPEREMVVGRTYEVAAGLSLEGLPTGRKAQRQLAARRAALAGPPAVVPDEPPGEPPAAGEPPASADPPASDEPLPLTRDVEDPGQAHARATTRCADAHQ
ncbi:MAG TPA: hypothetical protein VFB77_11300 [Acidimicrobiales bacterium]|nr:hypothetical protein [Acidimicrobiales bacterium]